MARGIRRGRQDNRMLAAKHSDRIAAALGGTADVEAGVWRKQACREQMSSHPAVLVGLPLIEELGCCCTWGIETHIDVQCRHTASCVSSWHVRGRAWMLMAS